MKKMAEPINKFLQHAVVAEFPRSNFLEGSCRLLFCKLVQRQLLVFDISTML